MGKHSKAILDQLIRSYEKSVHSNPFTESHNRRITYLMKKYKEYDVADLDAVREINGQIEQLVKKGYVIVDYDKEHINHMVRIILNLACVNAIYEEYYKRGERSQEAIQLEQILSEANEQIQTLWMKQFLKDEMVHLKETGWGYHRTGKDLAHIKGLIQTLCYIDHGNCSYVRTMSVQLFSDSKYFENEIRSNLISIVKKYEPVCLSNKDDDLTDSEVLRIVGLELYPEELEWTGDISILFTNGEKISTAVFTAGFILCADSLEKIESFYCNNIQRIILVENKASYYDMAKCKQPEDLIIFAGGHFSPVRRAFYKMIDQCYQGNIYLYSDIDLGGFLMYARLKREVFHNLQPYAMDKATYLHYLPYAKEADDAYLQKVWNAREKDEFACFKEVIECILENRKTLEQEAMMI